MEHIISSVQKILLYLCLSLKSGRHIFLMKVVSFYPGMEIRKISIDQGQEQTSSLVWYLSRKRLHTGVGLLFGLGSFRNLHSNNEKAPHLYVYIRLCFGISLFLGGSFFTSLRLFLEALEQVIYQLTKTV